MPQQAQNNMKAKSPSKLIQQGVDKSWGQQQKDTTNPQEAINQSHQKNPVDVPGAGK